MLCQYRSPGDRASATLRKERHGTTCCLNARGYDHPDADVGHIREPDCCGPSGRVLVRRAVPAADEDPLQALAPGTARRAALDDALAEMDAGLEASSARWRVRYGLMLGLERVLTEDPAHTAAGTELRRHQVDALAGMLAELIASTQRAADENGNGNGHGPGNGAAVAEVEIDEEADDDYDAGYIEDEVLEVEEFTGSDPGAVRRYRFRHPTASGKTI